MEWERLRDCCLLTAGLTECFKRTLETSCPEEKIRFEIGPLIGSVPGHQEL